MIFTRTKYKSIIEDQICNNGNVKGYQGKLAKAAKCHATFFSQVIHSHVHLTPEQAFHLTEFWEFSDAESEYFTLLVQYERSGSPTHRRWLKGRIDKLRQQSQNVGHVRDGATKLSSEEQQRYYSSWAMAAIHIAVSISELNTVAKLSQRLRLPEAYVEEVIRSLLEMGLISESEKGGWVLSRANLHLPRNSPLTFMNHTIWRQYAMNKLCSEHEKNIHYSSVMSMSKSDFDLLCRKILELIDENVKRTHSSKEEELYVFLADCFVM